MPDAPIHPADLISSRPVWLLDVEFAGHTWRSATEPVDVLDGNGDRVSYAQGLSVPRFEQTLGRLELDPGEATASFEVVLEGADIAALRREGHDLQRARATLWMVAVNEADAAVGTPVALQKMDERWWILDGRLQDPHYSLPTAPAGWLSATIQEDPWLPPREGATGRLMSADDQLTKEAFPSLQNASIGKYAPIVIGYPGWFPEPDGYDGGVVLVGPPRSIFGGGVPAYSGNPGLTVHGGAWSAPIILCREPVEASSVVIDYIGNTDPPESLDIDYIEDANGRLWPAVEGLGSAGIVDGAEPYFTAWFTGGGGITDPLLGGVLENAASVVAWALTVGGHNVDRRRWIAAIERLPVVNVAGYVNDPEVKAWDWLEDNILPLLPVTVARGRDGLRPIIYDPHLRTDEVRAHLVEGEDWHRATQIETARQLEDVLSTVRWNFCDSPYYGEPMQFVEFALEGGQVVERHESLYLQAAASRYGENVAAKVETQHFLWDRESAATSLRTMLRLQTMPLEVAAYRAPWHLGWLEVGDAVAVTDSRARLDDAIGIVSAKSWEGSAWRFEVTFDEDIVRDGRRVP